MAKKFIKNSDGEYYRDPKTGELIAIESEDSSGVIIDYLTGAYSGAAIDNYGQVLELSAAIFCDKNITEASFPKVSAIGTSYGYYATEANFRAIDGGTFMGCTKLSKISFPECRLFKSVNNFYNCHELESAIFPAFESTLIQSSTFYNCSKLSVAEFPTVTRISNYAFKNCKNLKTLNVSSDGLSYIGAAVFEGCESLENIKFASSTLYIAHAAFYSCKNLKNVYINCESISLSGTVCFGDCIGLQSVYITSPSSYYLNASCFSNCTSLKDVTLIQKNGRISFGNRVFYDCYNLENVTIDASEVVFQSNSVFFGCSNLKWGNLSKANIREITAGSTFYNCIGLDYVDSPVLSRITGGYTFANCSNISYASMPQLQTLNAGYTFGSCINLKYIYAPVVSYMSASNLFFYCTNLQSFYIMQKSGLTEVDVPVLGHSMTFFSNKSVGTSTPDGHPWIYVGYPEYVPWLQNATNWATYSSWIVASQFVPPTE